MNTEQIVYELNAEIARLTQARDLISGSSTGSAGKPKRTMSPETRKRMAAAQQKRYAVAKRAGK